MAIICSEKLLGIIVNKTGTWKHHLHGNEENLGLLKDLSKQIGMLRKLRNNLPEVRFKMLLSGLFTSKLIYGMTAWGTVWGSWREIPGNSKEFNKSEERRHEKAPGPTELLTQITSKGKV